MNNWDSALYSRQDKRGKGVEAACDKCGAALVSYKPRAKCSNDYCPRGRRA